MSKHVNYFDFGESSFEATNTESETDSGTTGMPNSIADISRRMTAQICVLRCASECGTVSLNSSVKSLGQITISAASKDFQSVSPLGHLLLRSCNTQFALIHLIVDFGRMDEK